MKNLTQYKIAVEMIFFSYINSERDGDAIATLLNAVDRLEFLHINKNNLGEPAESLWFRLNGSGLVTDRGTLDRDLRGKFASKGTTAHQNYLLAIEQMSDIVDVHQNAEVEIFFS